MIDKKEMEKWKNSDLTESINVTMKSIWYEGIGTPSKSGEKNLGMSTDERGREIMRIMFELIRSETMGEVTPIYHKKLSLSSKAYKIIFNNFARVIEKKEDVEQAIKDKISELEKHEFIIGLDKDFEFIYISLESVMEMIKDLRRRRIQIYKTILEEYQKDRERFDEIFSSIEFPP